MGDMPRHLLVVSFLIGNVIMIYEMAGFRMLAPWFGYDIAVWGGLIGAILFSLAIGYHWGGRLADALPSRAILHTLLLFCALWFALVLAFQNPILRGLSALEHAGALIGVLVLYAPVLICLGMVSPYITARLSTEHTIGFTAGLVYGIATLGSIIGIYFSAFYSLPVHGTQFTIALCVLLCTASSGITWLLDRRTGFGTPTA